MILKLLVGGGGVLAEKENEEVKGRRGLRGSGQNLLFYTNLKQKEQTCQTGLCGLKAPDSTK